MSAFRYRALDRSGRPVAGEIEAESARSARARLREAGYLPLRLDPEPVRVSRLGGRRAGLGASALVLLTQQLSTLLSAGLPLERALSAVIAQTEHRASRRVLERLKRAIEEGQSLALALAAQPAVFPPLYRALVDAGEQSGRLGPVMTRLADYLQRRLQTRHKLMHALAYPLSVLLVAFLVVAGLMSYVVPQVVGVFVQTRQPLPWLTRSLMTLSSGLRAWGAWGALALCAGGWVAGRLLRRPHWRRWTELRLLRLPLIGRLLRAVYSARMASTLAILVASGVPLLSALATVRPLLSLLVLQDALAEAAEGVRAGLPLSRALEQSRLFPPVLAHLVASGESSGTLALMLERAADEQQQEVERRLATFSVLLEPLLILLMGGVVMIIVLAVMLPIIEMNQMVR